MKQLSRTQYASGEELRYTTISATDLRATIFDGPTLTHVTLLDCDASGSHFHVRAYKSSFPRTSFVGADLRDAIFHRCDFRNTSLRGAALNGASFDGTSFAGADLTDADLTGANLVRAEDLFPAQIIQAKHWRDALLDPQVRRECELRSQVRATAAEAPLLSGEPTRPAVSWADRIMDTFSELERTRRPLNPASPATAARAAKAYSDIVRAPATKPRVDRSVDGEIIDLTREL